MVNWPATVSKTLQKQGKRDLAECRQLEAEGVDGDEIMRRVYFPWKTPEEYQRLKREYEAVFSK
jgi:hypothetical protein